VTILTVLKSKHTGSDREKAQKLENEEVVKQQKRKDP
jgi:hypothetical protein